MEKYVQIYNKERFEGAFSSIYAEGQYDTEDIKSHHAGIYGASNGLRSIIVPSGLVATLYRDDYFTGESLTLVGPQKVDLVFGNISGWADNTKSLIVRKTISHLNVKMYWERVYSSSSKIFQEEV